MPPPPSPPPAAPRAHVVVVDDDPSAIGVMAQLLAPHHEVLVANSGQAALDLLANEWAQGRQPSLVLLDWTMPDLSGEQTLLRLKALPQGAALPVIVVTAATDQATEIRALQLGAVDYVTKPVTPPVLLARVAAVTRAVHAERSAQEQQRLVAALVDSLPMGVALLRDDGRIRHQNRTLALMLRPGEALAHWLDAKAIAMDILSHGQWGTPTRGQKFYEKLTALHRYQDQTLRTELLWHHGQYFELTLHPLGALGHLLTCIDITSHKTNAAQLTEAIARSQQSRVALQQQLELIRHLMEHTHNGVLLQDDSGQALAQNRRFADLLGHEDWATALAHAEDPTEGVELTVGTPPHQRWVHLSQTPSRGDRRVVTATDITPRRRAQLLAEQASSQLAQDLAHSQERLQATHASLSDTQARLASVVHHMRDLFFIVSGDQQRLLFATDAFETLTGFTPQEAYDQPGLHLSSVHPGDLPGMTDALQAHLAQSAAFFTLAPFRVVHRSGTVRWVRMRAYPEYAADGRCAQMAGFMEDVTHSHEADLALEDMTRRYHQQVVGRLEQERQRLSQELHDEVGQMITALKLNLSRAGRQKDLNQCHNSVAQAVSIASDLMGAVRNIIHELHPPQLEDLGLVAALRWLMARLQAVTPAQLQLNETLGARRLPADIELACFRVVQEALTNAVRHASATEVIIQLQAHNGQLHLNIDDNGDGFDTRVNKRIDGHLGLQGMRERVLNLGGHWLLESAPELGTHIECHFPLTPHEHTDSDR